MRILAFTIGQHHLGLPAEQVTSVGKRTDSDGGLSNPLPEAEYNLSQAMDVPAGASDNAILCNYAGRRINLLAEKIIGLVDLEDGSLNRWPAVLKGIPVFYGVGLTDKAMYLLLDLSKIDFLKVPGE